MIETLMKKTLDAKIARAARRRRRLRIVEDVLLLPLALLVEFLERVVWDGTHALLDLISRAVFIARLRQFMQGLPPIVVVFLFLIPEAIDHLSGFWATVLLVKGNWLAATIVAIFIKGFAILLAIWIYQTCEQSLLSVGWFARLHHAAMIGKRWILERTARLRARMQFVLQRALGRNGRGRLSWRLSAWRYRLARMSGLSRR